MRIFLDANVLFSAAKSDGGVRRLLGLLVDAGHECWADGYVVEEARRNLVAKAPSGAPVLDTLLARMHVAAAQPHPAALEAAEFRGSGEGPPRPSRGNPVEVRGAGYR